MKDSDIKKNLTEIKNILKHCRDKNMKLTQHELQKINDLFITLENHVENKLRGEENYQRIYNSMQDVYYRADMEGKLIMVSPSIKKLLGFKPSEIINKNIATHLYKDPEKRHELLNLLKEKGEVMNLEVNLLDKKGKTVPIITNSHFVYDKNGKQIGIEGTIKDITERKETEKALRESEEKYRTLTNQLPVGVYRTTPEGKFIYFNNALANMLGYEESELYNIHIPDLYKNKKDREVGIYYLKNHNEGTTQREIELRTKQGKILIVNDHINAVMDSESKIQYFDGVLEDITERKKTEQALKESEEKFRKLAQTTSTAIMAYQGEKWVYANPAAERISGYNLDELKNMYYWEFVIPEHRDMIKNRGQQRQKSKDVPSGYEFKIKNKNGEIRWVYLEGSVMEYQGKPAGLISVIDITQMKSTEEKLKQKNDELRATEEELVETNNALKAFNQQLEEQKKELEKAKEIAEQNEAKSKGLLAAIPDMIFVFSKDGYIIDYHAEKKDYLYTSPENFLNEKIKNILPPQLAELSYKKIDKVLRTGGVEEYEYELPLEGKNFIFESRMVYLDSDKTLAIVRDITETKEAQKELIKAKEKAEESDRLKSAFLANMSHEIRTPINGIVGFTQLLKDQEYSKEEQQEFFDIIDLNSKQLLQIINDIIDISKIEANQLKINKKGFHLNKLMDELYNTYKMELERNNKESIEIKLSKSLSDEMDFIKTDIVRLKQILSNLLINAIKFTEEGSIKFGYETENNNEIMFLVKDTGIGISDNQQQYIFDHFRRAHESKSSKFGGTGLGLSISKKLVELLGGKIWVKSKENEGSEFAFTLPTDKKIKKSSALKDEKNNQTFEWPDAKILVVEDNPPSQRFIKEVLKHTNARIILAEDGMKAIEEFRKHNDLSIVLLDIKLPKKDGIEVAKEMNSINDDVPIIATTAFAMENDKKTALDNGCVDYLSKPINKQELLKTINKYI